MYAGPVEFHLISTQGKGEWVDRPELAEVERLIESGLYDILYAEDLGRMIRGGEAYALCKLAVRHGVRVIAPQDDIDTALPDWEEAVLDRCREHVGHNIRVSKRIKSRLMRKFESNTGSAGRLIAGYTCPPGCKAYAKWERVDTATPIYKECFRLLRATRSYQAVRDYLNDVGFPLGKYSRGPKWTAKMVRRVLGNPVLKGMPQRGKMHTVKNHDGHRVSVLNPAGPTFINCLHLIHVDSAEFDEVNAMMAAKNAHLGRKKVNGRDPLAGRSRKNSRFPGQHAECEYCHHAFTWGGNGLKWSLMCSGSRARKCWNAIAIRGSLAAEKLNEILVKEFYKLDGFDAQFRELVERAAADAGGDLDRRWADWKRRHAQCLTEKNNFLQAIRLHGPQPMYDQQLEDIKGTEAGLARERAELERRAKASPKVPDSLKDLRTRFEEQLAKVAVGSFEYARLMRVLVPEFRIHLVRLIDGGHLLPRATATVVFANIATDFDLIPGAVPLLTKTFTFDLFTPPQRERIRPEVVRLVAEGWNQREIARMLPEPVTQPAVSEAVLLDRLMKDRGLTTPYEIVTEPPPDYTKLRRHLNKDYRFTPLEDGGQLSP
jgi:hypothetical protein